MEIIKKLPATYTFSQSSLQDYVDCPRRFQLRYLDQLRWPAVEAEPVAENERHQQAGQCFHRLVQQHLIGLPVDQLTPLANTDELRRWWDSYLHSGIKLEGSTRYTEMTLSAPAGGYRLIAKYDLVAVQPGGGLLIFDWKTYLKRPRDERMAARLQTRVYRSLMVQAGGVLCGGRPVEPKSVEMTYWYADFPNEPACFPYDSGQYERDWSSLISLIREIGNHQHFPLTEDPKKCSYCPYRSYCNRGSRAGTETELEDVLPPEMEPSFEQIAEIEY